MSISYLYVDSFPFHPQKSIFKTFDLLVQFQVRLCCEFLCHSARPQAVPQLPLAVASPHWWQQFRRRFRNSFISFFSWIAAVGKSACGGARAPLFVLPCFHSRIPWMTTIQIYPSISGGQHEIFALIGNWHFVGAGTRSNIPTHKTSSRGQWEPNFVINHFLIWHFELFRFPFSAANSHGRLLPRCPFPSPRWLSGRPTLRWSFSRAVKV